MVSVFGHRLARFRASVAYVSTTDVLIVGGGPTGMVAALALHRLGVRATIVERQVGLQRHPKAHELSGRSIEILGGLGVDYGELAGPASPHAEASRILFCETLDREFGAIDLERRPDADKYRRHLPTPTAYLNVSQVEVEAILAQHVRARGIELRRGHTWRSLTQDDEGVVSTVEAGGETLEIRSRFVIAADGAASRCRAALGVAMIGPDKLRDFVSASFDADLSGVVGTRGKLYFLLTPAAPGVLIAHHVERRWVYHAIVVTPHERVEDFTPERLRDLIRAALGGADVEFTITSTSPWRMTAQVAERLRVGRVFLAGDAAHRFPPTGGLGMNSGVADAHNLAWKLAAVLQGRASAALLDSYELERRPVVQRLCDESRANFERMDEVVASLGLDPAAFDRFVARMSTGLLSRLPSRLRGWIRRALERYGAAVVGRVHTRPAVAQRVHAAIERQLPHFDRLGIDLGLAYEGGAVIADGSAAPANPDPVCTYVPTTRPGARFPHFWLDAESRRSSLEFVDYRRFTLLLGAGCVVAPDERAGLDAVAARLGVEIRGLADARVAADQLDAVHRRAEIAADGALLIRPDGHVAWRQAAGVRPSAALLESIGASIFHPVPGA